MTINFDVQYQMYALRFHKMELSARACPNPWFEGMNKAVANAQR